MDAGKRLFIVVVLLLSSTPLFADTINIDFDSFSDGDVLAIQIPGITFSNAGVLTAGASLNEIDFPPRSGSNVAFDTGAPILISFVNPAVSFSGYFTYMAELTVTAFDSLNNPVGSVTSLFSSNIGGDPGSSPNELLSLTFAGGFNSLGITGLSSGGSFVMDDLTVETTTTTAPAPVPEPTTITLLGAGLGVLWVARRWRGSQASTPRAT